MRGSDPCRLCKGVRSLVIVSGKPYVWRYSFFGSGRLARQARALADSVLVSALGALGLAGLLIFGWMLLQRTQGSELLDWSILFERNAGMLLFWLSLVGDMLLVSYVEVKLSRTRTLPARSGFGTKAIATQQVKSEEFAFLLNASGDLADYFSRETLSLMERAYDKFGVSSEVALSPLHLWSFLLSDSHVMGLMTRQSISSEEMAGKMGRMLAVILKDTKGKESGEFSSEARKGFEGAIMEALRARRPQVGPVELFIGLASASPSIDDLLADLNSSVEKLRRVAHWYWAADARTREYRDWRHRASLKPRGVMNRSYTALATPFLDRVSRDLTRMAVRSELPPVVGRGEEIDEVLRVLEGGGRSVVIVGDPGAGKTAMLYAIAERMASEDVPSVLYDKRLLLLDIPRLVAGAGHVGEVEERASRALWEAARAGNVILAIENIEHVVGVRSTGGELDLSAILAQALSERAILLVGTASADGYHTTLQGSPLGQALTRVDIAEMAQDDVMDVLETHAPYLEARFGVHFTYDAVEQAVTLSKRYMPSRALPDKAIALLEELAATARPHARGEEPVLTGEHVAALVSQKTHIPVTAVSARESDILLRLEEVLHKRIVGQDEAVTSVAAALRRARAEIRDQKRPIANFLFLGPTGVGKTETAKAVAEVYFGSEQNMVRLDMSEYQTVSAIYQLLGAPQGMGESRGYLTDAVRERPFSLVLLDEFEKAHPDILNIFLQIMDEGRATDSTGRTVDFTNTILIATSNAGTADVQGAIRAGVSDQTIRESLMREILPKFFRPELINRFDGVIVFHALTEIQIQDVARLLLADVARQLALKGIALEVTHEAVEELAREGFDPQFGARPLRRVIQERVDNALATYLLSGKLTRRDVAVLRQGGVIEVHKATPL